jgi:thymidylate kinase
MFIDILCKKVFILKFKIFFFLFFGSVFATDFALNGILLEGMDYSGKSTVCDLLEETLKERGFVVKKNHFYLSDNFIVKFLFNKAISTEGSEDYHLLYAAGCLLDRFLFREEPGIFYIQDRNWLTHDAWASIEFSETSEVPAGYFLKNHKPFKWNVLLTISYEKIQERFSQREKRSYLNERLFEDKEVFLNYHEYLISRIPSDENWLILDTSNLMPDEVVKKIVEYFGI